MNERSTRGVYTLETLREQVEAEEHTAYQVERLICAKSVNLLAGNSNIGKTPFAVALGVAVASGTPFLGLATQPGRVLYADSESGKLGFCSLLAHIIKHADLPEPQPNFIMWSPNWDTTNTASPSNTLFQRIEEEQPNLVIIDPLRVFFPEAEKHTHVATAVISHLRKLAERFNTSFVIIHHLRKMSAEAPKLIDDPYGWIQNVAGSLAIVNQTDARLGFELAGADTDDELVLGGFTRGVGRLAPITIGRERDEDGEPIGYRRLVSLDKLRESHREAYKRLPDVFRFTQIAPALGKTGDSVVTVFIKAVLAAGLVQQDRDTKLYHKVEVWNGWSEKAGVTGVRG